MKLVLLLLLGVVVGAAVLLLRGMRAGASPQPRPAPTGLRPRPTLGSDTEPATVPVAEAPIPPAPAALQAFVWQRAEQLPPAARDALLARLSKLRQPSRALQQLVSPQFIANAGSGEIAELLKGEPLVSARLLAHVNSAAYALSQPLVQVGQAVTFMGLNAVRTLCIQVLMEESFKADSAERQAALDAVWRAASRGSDIALRLAQSLRQPDPGFLATQVTLSFVGHLAATVLLPPQRMLAQGAGSLLARAQQEQEQLGLPAAEIGRLLMIHWGLPQALVDAAARVDQMLVAPSGDGNDPRDALAYLGARWGEQLDERHYAGPTLDDADGHHVHAILQQAGLRRWRDLANTLEWAQAMERLMLTTQG